MKTEEVLKTIFVGKNALWLDETASTNIAASALVLEKRPAQGTAVIADFQTNGRGQVGTYWESEHGKNLLVSYILYPDFIEPKDLFMLNKAMSLGIYDFVKSVLKRNVYIKWPNDIYYKDKKISGLLIENSVTFSEVNYSIAGIGINVNQTKFNAYIPPAVSLKLVSGKRVDLKKCFRELSRCIEKRYLRLKEKKISTLNNDYKKALYLFGKFCMYRKKQIRFRARIVDVMEDGKLVLENENGKFESFRFKEIALVMD
jgi:BirA family biotin operon repressor/biotin-[acetyl-CoA-carboxylase] ligase